MTWQCQLEGRHAAEAGSKEQDAVSQHRELFTIASLPVRCLMRAGSGILMIVSWFAISWLADLGRVISPVEASLRVGGYILSNGSWLLFP